MRANLVMSIVPKIFKLGYNANSHFALNQRFYL